MVYGLGGQKVNLVQGSGEDWATIHRQAGGGAQMSSLWHAESPWAQFIPPIQLHGRSPHVGPRAFCRIGRTICRTLSPSTASRSAAQRAPTTPPASRLPQEPRPGIQRPRPCFQLARKPDNLRVNRFIRTQTRPPARGQRRPRTHLAVNVRINGPTRTSTPLRVLRRAQSRMTD